MDTSGDVTEIQLSTRLDFSTIVLAVLALCLHSNDAIASAQNPKDTRILLARVSIAVLKSVRADLKSQVPLHKGRQRRQRGFPQVERLPWMCGGSSEPHPFEKRYTASWVIHCLN